MQKILIERKALKSLKKLDSTARKAIDARIQELAKNPDAVKSTSLVGHPNLRRTRTGDYRIVYTVNNDELIVTVVRIGHRKKVYRRL